MKNSRRDYTHDQALRLVEKMIQDQDYQYQLQQAGELSQLQTCVCLIESTVRHQAYRGAGTGDETEAKIKAIYEALEDLLCHEFTDLSHEHQDVIWQPLLNSKDADYLAAHDLLPSLFSNPELGEYKTPWLKLNNVSRPDHHIYYPLGLVMPHLHRADQYQADENLPEITKFANTTGIAIGATADESLLHGIYEWIERDAYGMFLLSSLVKEEPFVVINKDSLPTEIAAQIKLIEATYHDELVVVDMTTDMNIPAFLVSFTRQPVPQQPSGIGASLNKYDALTQALYEALQARDRYNANTVEARSAVLEYYQSYPILQRAYLCDLLALRDLNRFIMRDWHDVSTHIMPDKINEQVSIVANILRQYECDVYFNHLYQHQTGITLTYVLAVGVETFGMMREGFFTPIKKRGKILMNKEMMI